MNPFFNDCTQRLRDLHRGIEKCLAGLPAEALTWSPGPGINPLSGLVRHTCRAERFLINDMIRGSEANRNLGTDFEIDQPDPADLLADLRATLAGSVAALASMDLAGLNRMRTLPGHDLQVTLGWCILHAIDHTAEHLGHMAVTRQLWDQKKDAHNGTDI